MLTECVVSVEKSNLIATEISNRQEDVREKETKHGAIPRTTRTNTKL